MWRAERDVCMVIGSARVLLGQIVGGRWQMDSLVDLVIDASPERSLEALVLPGADAVKVEVRAASRAPALRVLVSERWLHAAGLPWSDAWFDDAAAARHARSQLADGGYLTNDGGELRLDSVDHGQPRLALNYPAPLMAAVRDWAARMDLRLASVMPLGVAAWRSASHPDAVVVIDEGGATLATGAANVLHDIDFRHGSDDWQTLWQRLQLRNPMQVGEPVVVDVRVRNSQGVPESLALAWGQRRSVSRLDAVRTRRHSPLAWVVAAACVALTAVAASDGAAMRREAQALRSATQPVQAVRTSKAEAGLSKQQQARVVSVNAAIRDLNLPMEAVLSALVPPRELRVALLSLEATGGAAVRMTAETRTPGEMARYLAYVAGRKPFTGATITHHEIDLENAAKPYRFTMEAAWAE